MSNLTNSPAKIIISGETSIPKNIYPPHFIASLRRKLTYTSKNYATEEQEEAHDFSEDEVFLNIPTMFYFRNENAFKHPGVIVEDCRKDIVLPLKQRMRSNITLKEKQKVLVSELLKQLAKGLNTGIFESGTGSGKSFMLLDFAVRSCRKTLILVHKESLLNQLNDHIVKSNHIECELGYLRGKEKDIDGKNLVLGMVETVMREKNWHYLNQFGLIIVDEADAIGCEKFILAIKKSSAKFKIGFTATPYHRGSKGSFLKNNFGDLIVSAQEMDIDYDTPVKPHVFVINSQIPIYTSGRVPTKITHYYLERINHNKDRNRMILTLIKYIATNPERRTLVLTKRRDYCFALQKALTQYGVESHVVVGGTGKKAIAKAKEGAIVISTAQYFSVGVSFDKLNTLIIATVMSNMKQKIGRILRQDDGIKRIIFDIADMKEKLAMKSVNGRINDYYNCGSLSVVRGGWMWVEGVIKEHPIFDVDQFLPYDRRGEGLPQK